MKKIFALIISITVICSALSARNFFSGRFFEIKVGTGLGLSNNLIAGNDIFQKDLVIDLKKLADECPDGGMNLIANATPGVEVNLNISKLHIGLSAGAELYGKFNIGKDLFDFAGYGNKVGETIDLSFTAETDMFSYSQLDVGWDVKKFKLHVKPAVFVPILSTRGNGGTVSVTNGADGSIHAAVDVNTDVYSPIDLEHAQSYFNQITSSGNILNSPLFAGYGFDLGAYLALPFSKSLSLDFDVRIPLAPGHIYKKSTITSHYSYDAKFSEISKGESVQENPTFSGYQDADLTIHRPLKFNVYLDKNLLGTLFNAHAGGGFGIRHPFADDAQFYPEYYVGLTFSLIDLFKLGVSSQYKDQVFIHQLGTTFSLRFVQIDLGVSTQSSNFKKSFEGAGVGAYAYMTVGF
jgi:hypothetical protein